MNHPMTWALAGRITVWIVLLVGGYALLVLSVARLMEWLGSKYPRVYATREEYYGGPEKDALDYMPPDDDDAVPFRLDAIVETKAERLGFRDEPHPPRNAA